MIESYDSARFLDLVQAHTEPVLPTSQSKLYAHYEKLTAKAWETVFLKVSGLDRSTSSGLACETLSLLSRGDLSGHWASMKS